MNGQLYQVRKNRNSLLLIQSWSKTGNALGVHLSFMMNIHQQPLERLLRIWQNEPTIADNIIRWEVEPEKPAKWVEFPETLNPLIRDALCSLGINRLYYHQAKSIELVNSGKNIAVVTSTASGKTFCYNLPVIDRILNNPKSCSLYIFPTKSLAQDQKESLGNFIQAIYNSSSLLQQKTITIPHSIYDGDTSTNLRNSIRTQTHLLFTNPDMLHLGILPHHTLWAEFFKHLDFIIIDEIHYYRGVFGSHIANVIRRLKRIARFYGASPQFIMTSATIANPVEHAERLVESPVALVDEDGAPRGKRYFLLYNPPIVQPDLGIRRSSSSEAVRLASDLVAYDIQTILFGRARRMVEMILKYLQKQAPDRSDRYYEYRSGYLPKQRRAIEKSLREGEAAVVVATNALELGIDIGNLDASILVGYPGTIAAVRQQAGRAGRRSGASLAVMVASSGPLDQFLMKHPEYLLERSPEKALINPDNLLIFLSHIRCAAFELPFQIGEGFGNVPVDLLQSMLQFLEESGELHISAGRYFWTADKYPANGLSLRSAGGDKILLQTTDQDRLTTIGEIDQASSHWMVHPDAIYLHEGQTFRVDELDLENHRAQLSITSEDYYTEPHTKVDIKKLSIIRNQGSEFYNIYYGEIQVTATVTGYRKIRWFTHEKLGDYPLDLPPTQLQTTAFWLSLADSTVDKLRNLGLWKNDPNNYGPNWVARKNLARRRDRFIRQNCGAPENGQAHHVHHKIPSRSFPSYIQANQLDNLITLCPACHQRAEAVIKMRSGLAGLGYVIHHLAPLFLMCDTGDLGSAVDPQSALGDGMPTIVMYDLIPAGIGLSEQLYNIEDELLLSSYELVKDCECLEGCPSCVGPAGENGAGGKKETLALLSILINSSKKDNGSL